jgi:hypothetical protein
LDDGSLPIIEVCGEFVRPSSPKGIEVGLDSDGKSFVYLPRLKNVDHRSNELVVFELCNFLVSDISHQVANTNYARLEEAWPLGTTFRIEINVVVITIALVDQAPNREVTISTVKYRE